MARLYTESFLSMPQHKFFENESLEVGAVIAATGLILAFFPHQTLTWKIVSGEVEVIAGYELFFVFTIESTSRSGGMVRVRRQGFLEGKVG